MKKKKYFAVLSASCGFLFALVFCLILYFVIPEDTLILSAGAGLLFGGLLFLALMIRDGWMNRRYSEFEKTILSPVFYQTAGNFNLVSGVRNGRIYFCEDGIVFASLDENPRIAEVLPLQNIQRYAFDQIHMNIYADDGRMFLITTPDAAVIPGILKEREWIS